MDKHVIEHNLSMPNFVPSKYKQNKNVARKSELLTQKSM